MKELLSALEVHATCDFEIERRSTDFYNKHADGEYTETETEMDDTTRGKKRRRGINDQTNVDGTEQPQQTTATATTTNNEVPQQAQQQSQPQQTPHGISVDLTAATSSLPTANTV